MSTDKASKLKATNHHAGHSLMNVLWFFFGGGLLAGIWWMLTGLLMVVTIIGIPWARAAFMFAEFSFHPFGRVAVNRSVVTGKQDIGTGCLGLLGNIVWFFAGGLWLAIGHLFAAMLCFITIIGIPFGLQHMKFASAALAPIGKTVIEV